MCACLRFTCEKPSARSNLCKSEKKKKKKKTKKYKFAGHFVHFFCDLVKALQTQITQLCQAENQKKLKGICVSSGNADVLNIKKQNSGITLQ